MSSPKAKKPRTTQQVAIYTVDAFSSDPFGGNPAAVALQTIAIDDATKSKIAAEMNLSETAFVEPHNGSRKEEDFRGESEFNLRWFTPTVEVPLCGHATLATTAALIANGNKSKRFHYHTLSGDLFADILDDGQIALDLPLNTCVEAQESEIGDYTALFGALASDLPVMVCLYSAKTKKLLIRLKDGNKDYIQNLVPKISALVDASRSTTKDNVKGIIVTTTDPEYDFVSRYFAPWVGIDEDPVCGAAHTVLAYYWSKELRKNNMKARQVSPRGGDLTVVADHDKSRTTLAGHAFVVMKGSLYF